MRRRGWWLGVPAVSLLAVPIAACSVDTASVGLTMYSPQGILEDSTAMVLFVFDASASECEESGHAEPPEDAQEFALTNTGCPDGVVWCGEISLDRDNSEKMFAVVASGAAGTIGEGCATATIDQDPVQVDITLKRFNPPACCNDGSLQVGETCETSTPATCQGGGATAGDCQGVQADAVCDCSCNTVELALDRPLDMPNPPAVGTRTGVALAFTGGNGGLQNGLRSVFNNTTASGGADVMIRALDADTFPIDTPISLEGPLALPNNCATVGGAGTSKAQQQPSIASITPDATAVVYASDFAVANQFDIILNVQGADGCSDGNPPAGGLVVNTVVGGASTPDVAGSGNTALIVWTQSGQVKGRTWDATTSMLGPELTIASSGSAPKVSGSATGFVVAYQGSGPGDGDGIFVRTVDVAGALGAEVKVNAVTSGLQDQPDVARLADGRFAVVWRSGSQIFGQRFAADGSPVGGDQDEPLSVTEGQHETPALSSAGGLGSFFVAAWADRSTGQVRARYLEASSGFLFNPITGQNDDFEVGRADVPGDRYAPAVVVGGNGFVAFAWEDRSAAHPGLFLRRFPLPGT